MDLAQALCEVRILLAVHRILPTLSPSDNKGANCLAVIESLSRLFAQRRQSPFLRVLIGAGNDCFYIGTVLLEGSVVAKL